MTRHLLRFTAVLAAALVATSCSGSGGGGAAEELPNAATLLVESATAMGKVTSAHFSITVDGEVANLTLKGAEGDLTSAGDAKGTAQVEQSGQVVEVEFVIVGDTLYFKGPTGGYQELPAALASTVYDPSVILDPKRGLPLLIETASKAKTEARETIDGVDAYRIATTVDKEPVAELLPGVEGDLQAELWVAVDTKQLLRAKLTVPGGNGADGGTVQISLSDFDADVTIAPPS